MREEIKNELVYSSFISIRSPRRYRTSPSASIALTEFTYYRTPLSFPIPKLRIHAIVFDILSTTLLIVSANVDCGCELWASTIKIPTNSCVGYSKPQTSVYIQDITFRTIIVHWKSCSIISSARVLSLGMAHSSLLFTEISFDITNKYTERIHAVAFVRRKRKRRHSHKPIPHFSTFNDTMFKPFVDRPLHYIILSK